MPNIIKVLPTSSFRSITNAATGGVTAATFVCDIDWGNGTPGKSYVKCFKDNEIHAVSNEITGYLLAMACGLNVPTSAGVIRLPASVVSSIEASCFNGQKMFNCAFAISEAPGKTPNTILSNYGSSPALQKIGEKLIISVLKAWPKVSSLIAFDDWVANSDRNLGNLLIDQNNDVHLIDHSNLPVSLDWDYSSIDKTYAYLNKLVLVFQRYDPSSLPNDPFIQKAATSHSKALNSVKAELAYWWSNFLSSTNMNALDQFLDFRANTSRTVTYAVHTGLRA